MKIRIPVTEKATTPMPKATFKHSITPKALAGNGYKDKETKNKIRYAVENPDDFVTGTIYIPKELAGKSEEIEIIVRLK